MAAVLQITQNLVSSVTINQAGLFQPDYASVEPPQQPNPVVPNPTEVEVSFPVSCIICSGFVCPAPPLVTMANTVSTMLATVSVSVRLQPQTPALPRPVVEVQLTSPRPTSEFSLTSCQIPKMDDLTSTVREEDMDQDVVQIHLEVDELENREL